MTLTRRFGRPQLDPQSEVLLLQMDQVGGILALSLNGQSITPVAAATFRYEIELSDLLGRNVLVIEIETPQPADEPAGTLPEWGVIALVVRTVKAPDES